jgi:hypothetical protein
MSLYRFNGGFPPPSVHLNVDNAFVNSTLQAACISEWGTVGVSPVLVDGFIIHEVVTPVAVTLPNSPDNHSCSLISDFSETASAIHSPI